jgi:hypothetical protein
MCEVTPQGPPRSVYRLCICSAWRDRRACEPMNGYQHEIDAAFSRHFVMRAGRRCGPSAGARALARGPGAGRGGAHGRHAPAGRAGRAARAARAAGRVGRRARARHAGRRPGARARRAPLPACAASRRTRAGGCGCCGMAARPLQRRQACSSCRPHGSLGAAPGP